MNPHDESRDPEYVYGGQWFDDMGALTLTFQGSPRVGVDIARSGVSRAQANDLAKNLVKTGTTGYDDQEASPIQQLGV